MRGSIKQRYSGSWNVIIDLGYETDPATGKKRRRQKWITVRGTKKQAQDKLTDLLHDLNKGQWVEPSKVTLGEWLTEWLEKAIKPPAKRLRTYETYSRIIEKHIRPSFLSGIRLQVLKAADLKRYYTDLNLAPATKAIHHAILHSSLKAATQEGLVYRNVAALVVGKPRAISTVEDVKANCWEAEEAKKFLKAARDSGPQPAAFYTLALETGMRKAELCGLKWTDVDLDKGKIQVLRQLIVPGREPVFGPPKNGQARTIDLGANTTKLLRTHKSHQAELKMANRTTYHDKGLMFAKEWSDLGKKHDVLGDPLQLNNLGQREYAKLIKAADVRPIKFHGLRHTCATLLFSANVPVKVIQERLGHKRVEITLNTYAHALPTMQKDAALRLSVLLGVQT